MALALAGCGVLEQQPYAAAEGAALPAEVVTVVPSEEPGADAPATPAAESVGTDPSAMPTLAGTTETPAAYAEMINQYAAAIGARLPAGDLMERGMCYVMADCYGDEPFACIGYAVSDLDGDGTAELAFGTTPQVTDAFYSRMVFDLYTLDANGACVAVFSGTERDRYYYAGQNRFVNMGASSAADSFETTLKLENGKMIDMAYATATTDYVQMELTRMKETPREGSAETTGVTLPILDEIDQSVTIGTAGSSLKAVAAAVKLLDWGTATGLDPEEIRAAAVAWLMNKGNDEQVAFAEKLAAVDDAYQILLKDGAEELLETAGCANAAYPWSTEPVESIEAIMAAVGLR